MFTPESTATPKGGRPKKSAAKAKVNKRSDPATPLTMHGCPSIAGEWTQANSAERRALKEREEARKAATPKGPSISGVSSSSNANDPSLYPATDNVANLIVSGKRARKPPKNDSDLSDRYSVVVPPAKKRKGKK